MRFDLFLPAMAITTCLLSGCANWNSIFHTFSTADKKSVSIDAKQRVIITDGERGIVCAEPSPDALSALSASLNASVITPERLTAQLAASNAESATSIGLRTQTIQLLRDAMYRVCEGYMSRALSGPDFLKIHRRYQNLMLGLLAVEQLTGTVTPHPVVLNGTSNGGGARDLLQVQEAVNAGSAEWESSKSDLASSKKTAESESNSLSTIEKEVAALEAQVKTDPSKQPELDKAKVSFSSQQEKVRQADADKKEFEKKEKDLKDNLKHLEALRDAARSVSTHASAGGTVQVVNNSAHPMNKETAKIVSDAVTKIIETIVKSDFSRETCLDYLVSPKRQSNQQTNVEKYEEESGATSFCRSLLKNQESNPNKDFSF